MNAPERPDGESSTGRHGQAARHALRPRRPTFAPLVSGTPAWDTPLDPMTAGVVRSLEMQAHAVPTTGTDPTRHEPEWLVRFAPPVSHAAVDVDDTGQITYLSIQGVSARALRSVHIHAPGDSGMQIDSLADARGELIAAGDLIDSMAWASGLPNMVIDTRRRGLRWASASVTLRIQSDEPEGAERASVTVLVE